MSEYLIRTLLNDIDIDPPQKLSIKYPTHMSDLLRIMYRIILHALKETDHVSKYHSNDLHSERTLSVSSV